MALEELQRDVDHWITNYTAGYFPPLMMLARLTEELGELARAVSHHHGGKRPKPGEEPGDIGEEIGDLLFVLVCLANQQGLKLDDSWAAVKKKLYERDATRWK
jgi:NTP pyrophosphatase (non-canonical NTP hydrolase)